MHPYSRLTAFYLVYKTHLHWSDACLHKLEFFLYSWIFFPPSLRSFWYRSLLYCIIYHYSIFGGGVERGGGAWLLIFFPSFKFLCQLWSSAMMEKSVCGCCVYWETRKILSHISKHAHDPTCTDMDANLSKQPEASSHVGPSCLSFICFFLSVKPIVNNDAVTSLSRTVRCDPGLESFWVSLILSFCWPLIFFFSFWIAAIF